MKKRLLKITVGLVLVIFVGGGVFYIITWYGFRHEHSDVVFGVTFSTIMARQLGLEPRTVFDAMVDDLGVKKIRLPVYWSDVEQERDKFDFGDYDYFIKKSESREVKLTLAIGRKLPRWPECFIPGWAEQLEAGELEESISGAFRETVMRYRGSSAVERWQVENEPFHTFGAGCANQKISAEVLDKEIALVRSLDSRPIMLTDSGEQGIWSSSLKRADIIGISIYYQVWNDLFRVVYFPFGPGFYKLKAKLFSRLYPGKKIIVSELQAEAWGPDLLPGYRPEFQKGLFDVARFREIIHRARRAGFDENYLWGVEWWYWLKEKQNDDNLWDEARMLF